MRRSLTIVGLVVTTAVVFGLAVSWLAPPTTDRGEPDADLEPEVHRLEGHESGFYPYLSDEPSVSNRSPINVVVVANLSEVTTALREQADRSWNRTGSNETAREEPGKGSTVNVTGTPIAWGWAEGSTRYAYLHDGSDGEWVREDAQLNDGDYFGFRHHIRLYESPRADEEWVAFQAHSEHFDWFTLRHTVHGVQEAQHRVESDLMGEPYVERVVREHLGNDGASDSDGWATVVQMAWLVPLVAVGVPAATRGADRGLRDRALAAFETVSERVTPRHVLLAALLAALVLGVRSAGTLLERHAPGLSVYAIGAILYPVLAFGPPVATHVLARGIQGRVDAGLTAAGAFGASILLDYAYVGVNVLPIDLLVHRVALVAAIGLVAAGSARRATRPPPFNATVVAGGLLWAGMLAAALFGWV